ncbi:hypothetical protein AHiyo4_22370 [Arthrobacter sp. Hiyo4]|nr:hypothetical protein AHiyo4_22370 [Arthrobacter sp. Hiyo4]
MQGVRLGHLTEVERFQDVQRFAHGGPATAGGRHAVDVIAAVLNVCRFLVQGPVCGEIRRRQVARKGWNTGGRDSHRRHPGGVFRRSLDCCRDLRRELSAVEGIRSLFREEPVRLGEVLALENTADGGSVTAGQEETRRGGESREPDFVVECLLAEGFVHDEAAVGYVDGRFEGLVKVQRAQRSSARSHVAGVPGTPTETPLETSSANV